MYIAIDGNEANEEDRVGVHQYAYNILSELYNLNNSKENKDDYLIILKNIPKKDLPDENKNWKYRVLGDSPLWILTKLQKELLINKKIDIFFTPSHYLPLFSRSPMICAIHDLGYLKFSEQFKRKDFWQLKLWTAISLYISKHIITFSDFTKKDIVRHYPSVSNKATVVYHGYDKKHFINNINDVVVRRVKKKYKIVGNYILFLGTLKPSKNIEGLIEAFRILTEKDYNYRLVIAGKKGWLYESIFNKAKLLKLEDRIVFTDYVNESDKPALIAGAKVFALPSFWEGFGMDIISSFACGTPVVGGNTSSIPEVGGKEIILCNPHSSKSIAEALEKVINMPNKEYNILKGKCIKRAESFSWDKSAKLTYNVLENFRK